MGGDNRGIKSTLKAVVQRETLKEEVKLTAAIEAGNLSLDKGSSRVVDRFFLGSQKMRGLNLEGLVHENAPVLNAILQLMMR